MGRQGVQKCVPRPVPGPPLECRAEDDLVLLGLRNCLPRLQRQRGPAIEHIELRGRIADRYLDRDVCLDEAGSPPEDFDLATFANTSFGYFEAPPEDVVLHVLPHGMEDFKNYRFHASQTVEDHPDGGVIVRFRASGMLELA